MTQLLEDFIPVVNYVGLNTNKAAVLGSTLSVAGAVTLSAALSVTGIATFTAAPVFTAAPTGQWKNSVTASGGTTRTLAAANSGSVNLFDSAAGIVYTLPAPAVGLYYDFLTTVTQTSAAHTIITDAGTTFVSGAVIMFSGEGVTPSATLGPKMFAANGTSHVKYTTNGTTTGGGIGTWLRVTCIDATHWAFQGVCNSPSGTIATPFST